MNIQKLQKMFMESIDMVKLCAYTKHMVYGGNEAELFGENNSVFFANRQGYNRGKTKKTDF